MKRFKRISQFILILLFVSACKSSGNKKPIIKDSVKQINEEKMLDKKSMEIRVSCGKGGISKFLDDGWIIIKESTQEKICSWKSFPASKNCDMEKDKGCKITKPDKIGEEKIYILQK